MSAVSENISVEKEEAIRFLIHLAESMKKQEASFEGLLQTLHPQFQTSARNLLHYLILRSEDIRPLQEFLHHAGLSSLTSSESHTLSQLLQVLRWLTPETDLDRLSGSCDFNSALLLRQAHQVALLGNKRDDDLPHIMVTFSEALGSDLNKIEKLLDAGMTIARINCAHDDNKIWAKIISNVRQVSETKNKPCKIYMDLAGPKIRVGAVPVRIKESKAGLLLTEGDIVCITDLKNDVRKAKRKRDGRLKLPARIVIQPAGLISTIKKGERIFFDDGKFEAVIIETKKRKAWIRIVRISARKRILKAGKGVNLPDTDLAISSLTGEDISQLPFVAEHADLVGYSFVSTPGDLQLLRNHLRSLRKQVPAVILKIERLSAIYNLPALLLEAMKDERFGVMIARGDLAVEIGFERLSEIQQEILWICEAAHVPVIWATQVLENLNKTGFATRSEITDASMSAMAECVMLNKGEHVIKTVHTLVNILERITTHVDKKRYTFRPLSIARNYWERN